MYADLFTSVPMDLTRNRKQWQYLLLLCCSKIRRRDMMKSIARAQHNFENIGLEIDDSHALSGQFQICEQRNSGSFGKL